MKKIIIILIILLSITGCKKEEKKEIIKVPEKIEIQKKVDNTNIYTDLNNTPIGIYELKGNVLKRIHNFNTTLIVEKDINTFQIFPSNEETINLNTSFGQSFYNEWIKYQNIKQGFNIKFTLKNEEKVSFNIFNPTQTFDRWEHLMNYLYDDYANLGKGFYSHLEEKDFTENTLVTAFKMQVGYAPEDITSKIELSAFTYDTEDDFENNEYRGNSIHTINICIEGYEC